ncbi:MAG: hypothetical protein U0836_06730 [Pirellulales bacterium]
MKLRSTLALALALAAGAAHAQEVYVTPNGSGPGCSSCAGGSGAEAWLVPRPGPQGYSHPATTVYSEKCCRDHYPGCCDNVWDGYCSERYCWHSDKAGHCGPAGCYGYGYGTYAGQRWGAPRGWSGGGWGWNPGYGGAPTVVSQPVGVPSGTTATWSSTPTPAPAGAVPAPVPTTTVVSPSADVPVATPGSTGESPSARNWSGYPRSSRTW